MNKKKLHIGTQNLKNIIEDNYYHVNTTYYVWKLANRRCDYYSLSRSIRFGKSLSVDVIKKEMFAENKELFKGLYSSVLCENYCLLAYLNYGLKTGINNHFTSYFTSINSINTYDIKNQVVDVILNNKVEKLEEVLKSFYTLIHYEWYIKNELDKYKGYYTSVLYTLVTATGLEIKVQGSSNRGKLDMVVEYEGRNYIMKFKLVKNKTEMGNTIKQIKEKEYNKKYKSLSRAFYLVGIKFSKKTKNIVNANYGKVL